MSAGTHQRREDNAFLGVTDEALQADVTYARQLWLLQWAQYRNPDVIIQVENPKGAIEKHPLSVQCVLLPYEEGGMGCDLAHLSNCNFPSAQHAGEVHQKHEVFLTNNEEMLEFCKDGKYVCTAKTPCTHLQLGGKHETLEGTKCSAAAAFTPELARQLATLIDAGVRARDSRGTRRPRSRAPVDVRQILRNAAKDADATRRGAPSQTYVERHGVDTYLQRVEALLLNAGIGEPPPHSSPLALAASWPPSAQASACSPCSHTGAAPEAEAEAEVGLRGSLSYDELVSRGGTVLAAGGGHDDDDDDWF